MNKALIIILNEALITTRSGKSFPINTEDWKFKLGWYDMFKKVIDEGGLICIVDNQFAVGEGLITEYLFYQKIEKICKIIENDLALPANSIITNFCYNTDNNFRTKPNPGLLYEIALEYDIRLDQSTLIGVSKEDEEFAKISGVGIYYDIDTVKMII